MSEQVSAAQRAAALKAANAATKAEAEAEGLETTTLGGVVFILRPLPWKAARRQAVAIYEVGAALASGEMTDAVLDKMSAVLAAGLQVEPAVLDELPTNVFEAGQAFQALMRVSGMQQQMEHALGEMLRRRQQASPPAVQASPSASEETGTPSTPAPQLPPDGDGGSSTK